LCCAKRKGVFVLDMALLVVKRGLKPKPKPKVIVADSIPIQENTRSLEDWDSFLHSLWLDIMKTNPGFYDDAKINHSIGHCKCRCTGNLYLREGHKRK
jgi:hypothetical protein